MAGFSEDVAEAVLFFEEGAISREMLYTEFEAILDGFIPIPEFASRTQQAVFLRINRQFCIKAAVFFLIGFDASGFADRRWNVPLVQFADNSATGPDLGAGPIRLACYSQCSIAWHQQQLWDPDMSPGNNHFAHLRKAAEGNRIGVMFSRIETPPMVNTALASADFNADIVNHIVKQDDASRQHYEQELRLRVARQLKEQRLRAATLISQHRQAIQDLQLKNQQRLESVNNDFALLQKQLGDEHLLNAQLKETIAGQATKLEGMREYFEHKVQSSKLLEHNQLNELKKSYELELEAKLESAITELREQLQIRDIELLYRNELLGSRGEEVDKLREENQRLLAESGDQLLAKLQKKNISFVAYHPGSGHITVPLGDMAHYLENTVAYVADKCGVTANLYRLWLDHYHTPLCQALKSGGDVCKAHLTRVDYPSDFHAGESDRCKLHQTNPAKVFAVGSR